MANYTLKVDSVAAFAKIAASSPKDGWSRTRSNLLRCNVSFADALHMAIHGWPEGAEEARKLLKEINIPPLTEPSHSATFNHVTGSYVDIGEYVQGTPECMVEFREDLRPARFAHIVIATGYRADVHPNKAMCRGAAIAAVIDALESQGIRCEIGLCRIARGAYDPNTSTDHISTFTVAFKRAEQPLNLDLLAFAVANPAFHRCLTFAVMECQSPEYRANFGCNSTYGSYGSSINLPDMPNAILFQRLDEAEPWTDRDYAIQQVNSTLTAFYNAMRKEQS